MIYQSRMSLHVYDKLIRCVCAAIGVSINL